MRYHSKTKAEQCYFCASGITLVNFKDAELLKRFLSPQAKILPRKKTALCAMHQRRLARAVKRARFLALIPYVTS
ncbi:MAG: 30S ribosomal protein S18 [Patescibacteria group bacterium]